MLEEIQVSFPYKFCNKITDLINEHEHKPCFNHIPDFRGLVDATIIHYNDEVRCWIRLHLTEQSLDEVYEKRCIEGSFHDVRI